ncbi:type III-B CRISPR module RAMP protein Cmr6 [bacterium]|nr:type III-B CRISPR module RAMP protein Cmr6 [bacterium]
MTYYPNKQNSGGNPNRGGNNYQQNRENEPPKRFPVPKELQGQKDELLKSTNFALVFQKYLLWESRQGKLECKDYSKLEKFKFDKNQLQSVLEKQKLSLKNYAKENGFEIVFEEVKNDYRLACGLGGSSVWSETGMTLHHVYGFPFIPGSSVKGLVRMLCEKNHGKAKELFGDDTKGKEHASKVDFFDVFPMESPEIKADIMNPHFGDYYQDKKNEVSPGDWLSPVPVNFLTVQGGKFRFPFVCKRKEDAEVVKKLLKEGLSDYGIGAKTKVGYGFFS